MTSAPLRLLGYIVAAVVAVLWGPLPAGAAHASAWESGHAAHAYTYDHHPGSLLTHTTTERGPPAGYGNWTDYDSDGMLQSGDRARPEDTATAGTYDYDGSARFVQTAGGSHAAGMRDGDPASGLAVALRASVAAKTGDDLIRLSTKDSWANLKTLDDHFARHGAEFGATSADDYARMGSEFFQRGGAQHLPTKIAPDGTIRMYDPGTNTFGSFAPNGMTKTLFKPTSVDYWSRQPGVLQ